MSGPRGEPARLGFLATIKAVLWSFIGLRRGSDHRAETARLNPVYVIVAGLILAIAFVATLVWIVGRVVG